MKRDIAIHYAKELVKKVLDRMDYDDEFKSVITSVNVPITDNMDIEDKKDSELAQNLLNAFAEFIFPEDDE